MQLDTKRSELVQPCQFALPSGFMCEILVVGAHEKVKVT